MLGKTPERDSNPNLPCFRCPISCESDALDQSIIEPGRRCHSIFVSGVIVWFCERSPDVSLSRRPDSLASHSDLEEHIMGTTSQQYCLRWNNHRSNLLTVFDELLRNEAFTDVTLACEGSVSVKCHKMVLAACSSYFQALFTELPCRHPVVVLKDVKYSEMKAILEYMYRGEVNVAQDQLAALLKVAQALKVKGLVEERGPATSTPRAEGEANPTPGEEGPRSPPNIATSVAPLPHSSSGNTSPPQSSGMPHYDKNPPYNLYGKSPVGRMSLPMWAVPGLPFPHHPSPVPAAPGMCYEASSADMSPLKRKKLQSLLMSRDTPILRTVLGQGQPDSSQQPMALVSQPDSHDRPTQYNGSAQDMDKVSSQRTLDVSTGLNIIAVAGARILTRNLQAWSTDGVHQTHSLQVKMAALVERRVLDSFDTGIAKCSPY
uniref:BTB domain-containing protein n=1 Tax=Timema cristinae TaxID=61476 RepID=A0A7R9CUL0_TIMCR|nr:unnamed protein product [Timema cristinae]